MHLLLLRRYLLSTSATVQQYVLIYITEYVLTSIFLSFLCFNRFGRSEIADIENNTLQMQKNQL